MHIGVVTDSASDLPSRLLDDADVISVPLDVRLGDTDPEQLRTLSNDAFWSLLETSNDLPSTAAPSPGSFLDAYRTHARRGCDAVVCVTISSELSATYQAALVGATQCEGEIPVRVVDSRTATMGEGLLVIEAMATRGQVDDLSTIAEHLERTRSAIATFGTLDTLDSLRRGGRIGGAQAFFGTLLSIKPIIEVQEGRIEGISRQRTRNRSLSYVADKAKKAGPLARLSVVHAAATDIDRFVALLDGIECATEPIVTTMGPIIGSHVGVGTIGVALQTEQHH